MMRRHQAYLLARIRPHGAPPDALGNRRCIAGFHHHRCYGTIPLKAICRLISLISQPENAAIIRAELHAIQGRYGSEGATVPQIPDIPCPYTASLLASAWSTDLHAPDGMYTSGYPLTSGIIRASVGYWDLDNSDGITMIDVTEPENPAYCFLNTKTPLDARQYLSIYYKRWEQIPPISSDVEEGRWEYDPMTQHRLRTQAVRALADIQLIPVDILREAWPEVKFQGAAAPPPREPKTVPTVGSKPSLAGMTLSLAIKHAIDSGDTTELEKFVWLPEKAAQIYPLLRDLSPFPDAGVKLLIAVLSELKVTTRIDLSSFQMSASQVADILDVYGDVQSLDISYNAYITADDILTVLASAPNLRRLVAMGCSSVEDSRILELVQMLPSSFKTLEGLLHPAFLTVMKPDPYPVSFAFINTTSSGYITCASLPFYTPAQVVQALADVIPWREDRRPNTKGNWAQSARPMAGLSAFHACTRRPDQPYHERTVGSVPFLTLRIPFLGQTELWAFVCRWRYQHESRPYRKFKLAWAFIHYTRQDKYLAHRNGEGGETNMSQFYTGRVYDLRGFLDCMAGEGRPMPTDEAVQTLQDILWKKTAETGELCCPLMAQEDVDTVELPDVRRDPLRYDPSVFIY